MRWWEYIILVVVFYAGSMVSAFSIIIPSICVNFGIPFSKIIQRECGINTSRIIKVSRKTVFIWLVINLAALAVLIFVIPLKYTAAYCAGCVFCFLTGVGRTKMNAANISDYYITYRKYIAESDLEAFDAFMSQFQ